MWCQKAFFITKLATLEIIDIALKEVSLFIRLEKLLNRDVAAGRFLIDFLQVISIRFCFDKVGNAGGHRYEYLVLLRECN